MANTPISDFPAASSANASDVLAGVQDGVTKKFSFAIVLNWIKQQLDSLFVPTNREINGKPLNVDITLDASDVGAVDTADVGVADGVASLDSTGKVPSSQLPPISSDASDITYDPTTSGLTATDVQAAIDEVVDDLDGKQSTITANGILKGDGQGGVSAATPGTDYGTYSKPSGGIPSTDLASAVQTSLGKADTAYQKPSSGIPSSDMASGVQTSLGKADTAYQKPSGGIPASDLANGVIPTVPSAYTSDPAMDGTASPGSSGAWARGDHVHPRDTSRVPVYGMGKNLLDNAYFLNPVNQRGQTALSANGYFIDRWAVGNNANYGTVSLVSDGLSMTHSQNTGYTQIGQVIENLSGKKCTLSGIVDSVLRTCTFTFNSQGNALSFGRLNVYSVNNQLLLRCPASTSDVIIKALKLELGTEQTLCHNEGTAESPVWVLNEIPNYEEELIKCQTSTADSSDTYANKSLATEQQLAYVETGTTASRAYAIGEYFCWNGLLYRVTSAISSGGTFTPGTNCTQTTAMSAIRLATASWTTGSGGTVSTGLNVSAAKILAAFAVGYDISVYLNASGVQGYFVKTAGTNNPAGNVTISVTAVILNY